MWRCSPLGGISHILATQKLPADNLHPTLIIHNPPFVLSVVGAYIFFTMAPISIADLVAALPAEDAWGPATSGDNMLEGVPYAPFAKGDKLGRMADWTAESKDRAGQGRQQYNRNFRGKRSTLQQMFSLCCSLPSHWMIDIV
jgi:hypothetical protein